MKRKTRPPNRDRGRAFHLIWPTARRPMLRSSKRRAKVSVSDAPAGAAEAAPAEVAASGAPAASASFLGGDGSERAELASEGGRGGEKEKDELECGLAPSSSRRARDRCLDLEPDSRRDPPLPLPPPAPPARAPRAAPPPPPPPPRTARPARLAHIGGWLDQNRKQRPRFPYVSTSFFQPAPLS